MNQEKINKDIDSIIEEFNFHKVWGVMQSLGWTWHFEDVPTIPELKRSARHYLEECAKLAIKHDEVSVFCDSGGFHTEGFFSSKEDKISLRLMFCLESWEENDWEKYPSSIENVKNTTNDELDFLEI